jgi:hypothetical protein
MFNDVYLGLDFIHAPLSLHFHLLFGATLGAGRRNAISTKKNFLLLDTIKILRDAEREHSVIHLYKVRGHAWRI